MYEKQVTKMLKEAEFSSFFCLCVCVRGHVTTAARSGFVLWSAGCKGRTVSHGDDSHPPTSCSLRLHFLFTPTAPPQLPPFREHILITSYQPHNILDLSRVDSCISNYIVVNHTELLPKYNSIMLRVDMSQYHQ